MKRLQVWLFGGFRVDIDGHTVPTSAWVRRAAQHLVQFLALSYDWRAHREQIIAALWPDAPPDVGRNHLRRSLHYARHALNPIGAFSANHPWLTTYGEIVSLGPPDQIWVDVRAFEAALDHLDQPQDVVTLATALNLYRGPLLPDEPYVDWVGPRRDHLHAGVIRLASRLAERLETQADHERAQAVWLRLNQIEPSYEAAHVALIKQFGARGESDRVLKQYHHLADALKRELGVKPMPETRLLVRTLITQPRPRGDSVPPEPVGGGAATRQRSPLPQSVDSFIGREAELAELRQLIDRHRLVTLTGPGGAGKTRLAIELAGAQLETYRDGVVWLELAPLADPKLVLRAVASTLRVHEETRLPLVEMLVDVLTPKQTLLVFDNCEHLIQACADLITTLLRRCPEVTILATSREALGVAGEHLYPVPALDALDPTMLDNATRQVQAIGSTAAARLFLDRGQAVDPTLALTAANALSVARICHHLDGLPLAIELAAARLRALTVEQIAARLADRFRLLTKGVRTAEPRQQTLRASIDWSYRLLDQAEQTLFRRLAVFSGGFTLEAAESICSGADLEMSDVLDGLLGLVDRSMVIAEATAAGGMRYRLLETMRVYASERLVEANESTTWRDRHLAHWLAFAEMVFPYTMQKSALGWVRQIAVERPNLRAAMTWSQTPDRDWPATLAEVGARLPYAISVGWYVLGEFREIADWLAKGEQFATTAALRGRINAIRAGNLTELGELETAKECAEVGSRLGHASQDPLALGVAQLFLGRIAAVQHQQSLAYDCFIQAEQTLAAEYPVFAVTAQIQLGIIATHLRRFDEAERWIELGLRQRRAFGVPSTISYALVNHAALKRAQGDLKAAQALLTEAQAHAHAADGQLPTIEVKWHLGLLALAEQRWVVAARHLLDGLLLTRAHGSRRYLADLLLSLGVAMSALERQADAGRLLAAGDALASAHGSNWFRFDEAWREAAIATARHVLGESAFMQVWAEASVWPYNVALVAAIDFAQGIAAVDTPD